MKLCEEMKKLREGLDKRKVKWTDAIDMCDECARLYREKKRQEYFGVADFKEDKDG